MVDSVLRRTAIPRIVGALLFGALVGASAARADDMQEANALLKAGHYGQALEHVNKVIAAKPQDPQARFLKGLIFTEQGDTKDAIEVFQKLTQDYPGLPEPYNNLAVIYASQGHYEKARAALEKSIRTHSSYATAYENLGDVYARLASQAYDKALQLDSSNSTAQSKLMLVRSLVGTAPQASASTEGKVAQALEVAAAPATAPPAPSVPAPAPAPEAKSPPVVEAATEKPPAPAPAPEPAAKPTADLRREVLAAVDAWAGAWSSQDVGAYLAHYAPDFKTPHGEPRSAWERLRRSRVTEPKSIAVEIKSPKVTRVSDTEARVSFRQIYRSDRFSGTSDKSLEMVKIDGRWLIRQEQVGG
ncbi:MAG TPA: tetratricopeptide repeat protein [Burkholderiales bacterium]|nr:tetratricopeptide repeat protein [Burkholderiales bacterium]